MSGSVTQRFDSMQADLSRDLASLGQMGGIIRTLMVALGPTLRRLIAEDESSAKEGCKAVIRSVATLGGLQVEITDDKAG